MTKHETTPEERTMLVRVSRQLVGEEPLATHTKYRDFIAKSSYWLAKTIARNQYKNVFFLDSGAHSVATGVSVALDTTHRSLPKMGFISPLGLISQEYLSQHQPDQEDETSLTGRLLNEHAFSKDTVRTEEEITQEIQRSYMGMRRNKKTLLVDICIHTGEGLLLAREQLQKAGFTTPDVAVFSNANTRSELLPNFVFLKNSQQFPDEETSGHNPYSSSYDRVQTPFSIHSVPYRKSPEVENFNTEGEEIVAEGPEIICQIRRTMIREIVQNHKTLDKKLSTLFNCCTSLWTTMYKQFGKTS